MDPSPGAESNETRPGASKDEDKDIISNLHESVISHILSFLPMEDAIRTSVLSKFWIDKWTLTTSLHFDDLSYRCLSYWKNDPRKSAECFLNFVENTIAHVSGNSTILSLTLRVWLCHLNIDSGCHLSDCVNQILTRRHIQKLHICCKGSLLSISSLSLFSCDSLVHIDLKTSSELWVPANSPNLPNLRILKLRDTRLRSDSKEELVLKLPALRVFEARNCSWCNVKTVCLETPLLESFSMESCRILYCKKFPCASGNCRKYAFKICTKSIKSFSSLSGFSEECFRLSDSSSLIDASLSISFVSYNGIYLDRLQTHEAASEIYLNLKQLHKVKELKLNLDLEVLARTGDFVTKLPSFENLTSLELDRLDYKFDKYLLNLFHKSPNLKTLVFGKKPLEFDSDVWSSTKVPYCFQSNLKVVEIKECCESECELDIVKFIIEKAQVLEQMTIGFTFRHKNIEDFMNKVQSFSKRIRSCTLINGCHLWLLKFS